MSEHAKALRADEKAWRKARASLLREEFVRGELKALEWVTRAEFVPNHLLTVILARIAELKGGKELVKHREGSGG